MAGREGETVSWLFQSLSNLKIRAEGVETGREGAEGPRKRRAVSRSRVRSRDGDDLQFKRREEEKRSVCSHSINQSRVSTLDCPNLKLLLSYQIISSTQKPTVLMYSHMPPYISLGTFKEQRKYEGGAWPNGHRIGHSDRCIDRGMTWPDSSFIEGEIPHTSGCWV